MDQLRHLEAHWIAVLQHACTDVWLVWLMKGLSYLGLQVFYAAAVALYVAHDRRTGIRFCWLFFGAAAVSEALKLASHGPRPFWIDPEVINYSSTLNSFGMPSGHMFYAACCWPFLAGLFPFSWSKPVAALAIALVGVSRVWLGAHFISDVAGGLAAGLIYWKLVEVIHRYYGDAVARLDWRRQLGLALAMAGVIHAAGLALKLGGAQVARQAGWSEHLTGMRWDLSGPAGLLLGFAMGLVCMRRFALFTVPKDLQRRVLCLLMGGAGLAAFHYGIRTPSSLRGTGAGQWLEFARYFTMTFWLAFVTPWICLRLGWLWPGDQGTSAETKLPAG